MEHDLGMRAGILVEFPDASFDEQIKRWMSRRLEADARKINEYAFIPIAVSRTKLF